MGQEKEIIVKEAEEVEVAVEEAVVLPAAKRKM